MKLTTTSNEESSKGSAATSATRYDDAGSASWACRTSVGEASIPVSSWPRSASRRASRPSPQPASRTTGAPGSTSSRKASACHSKATSPPRANWMNSAATSSQPFDTRSSLGRFASLSRVAETVNTNQFKNGMHIGLDGGVWRIVEFQHVKPGKGGAFVRTKLKNLDRGAVVDRTFRAGEKFPRVHTETKNVQYLYDSGDEVVFMDEESYEQITLRRTEVADV